MTTRHDTAEALSRLQDPSRAFLISIALLAALVNYPMQLQVGSISSLAVLTILIAGMALALWLARPWFPLRQAAMVMLPLIFYIAYCATSFVWYPDATSTKSIQLFMVLMAFLGLILVTAREVDRQPAFAWTLMKVFDASMLIATTAYLLTVPIKGMGNEDLISPRGYAIFALLGVARMLARWRQGDRMAFWYAAYITMVIVLSISRTAMVMAVALFPLATLSKLDMRGAINATLMTCLGGLVLAAVIMLSPTMKERFFGFDTSMSVGGVAINASGRQQMWNEVWRSARTQMVFGQGIGSSALLIDEYFPALGHPHNDFLRLLHDEGIIGLSCYAGFLLMALSVSGYSAYQLGRRNSARSQFFLAAALSIVGIAATHATDNTISYSFVMMPFALVLGCGLGLRTTVQDHTKPSPSHYEDPAEGTTVFGRRRFHRKTRPAITFQPALNRRRKGVA